MKIYFVRHGQSTANLDDVIAGKRDVDLTEKGLEGAKKLGEKLKKDNYSFDYVFSSNMIRAKKTASILVDEMKSSQKVHIIEELRERDCGDFEMKPSHMLLEATKTDIEEANMESLDEMLDRISSGIEKIYGIVDKDSSVLIVAHAGVYRILKIILDNLPVKSYFEIKLVGNTILEELK